MTSLIGLCRSPFCSIHGHLSNLNSCDLITRVIESALKRAHVDPKWVKSIFLGQVLPQLQNISIISKGLADIDLSNSNIITLNSLCNSGLSSIILANKMTNTYGLSVAGGVDSLSNSPYMIRNDKPLETYNDGVLHSSIKSDYHTSLSRFKEDILTNINITNSEIERYRVSIWKKTLDSLSCNILEQEITPFRVKLQSHKPDNKTWITPQERIIHRDQLLADIPKFHKNNDTPLVDGASAIVLSSSDFIKKHNLNEITRIIATSECRSDDLTESIKDSFNECLSMANLVQSEIQVYEFEDYLSHIPLYISKVLNIDIERTNLHGGSTAIGFCPGSSGTRLAISLTSVLRSRGLRYGCAMAINSLGQVSTVILENPSYS